MKFILPLLFLTACSSVSQTEPWNKGDCVATISDTTYYKIIYKPEYKRSRNPNKPYEWFYKMKLIKTVYPDIVLKRIDCDSIPKE